MSNSLLIESALMLEVERIVETGGSPYHQYEIILHAGENELSPLSIMRMDIMRDYRKSSEDDHTVVLVFGLGTVMYDIGPYENDLKMTIKKLPMESEEAAIDIRTYRAYVEDVLPNKVEARNNPVLQDKETADNFKTLPVTFRLEEVAAEQLRFMTVGTTIRGTSPGRAAKALLVNAINSLDLAEEERMVGVDMIEPDNTESRSAIVIPDGTPLLDIPDLMQNDYGGIYSTALGFYLQRDRIYLWPLYNMERQETASRVLQIYMSPDKSGNLLDATWADFGRTVSILSAGITKVYDESSAELNQEGDAIRYIEPGNVLDGFADVSGNKMVASPSKNVVEVSGVNTRTGKHLVKTLPNPSNYYLEMSKLAKRAGVFLFMTWRYSNPDLITPGMPVEIYFEQDGDIRVLNGALVGCATSLELNGHGLVAKTHVAASVVTVMVNRDDPEYIAFKESQ